MITFIRFKDYENYAFGIVFNESIKEDDGLLLTFDIWRAQVDYLLDEYGNPKEKGFVLMEDNESQPENLLMSGFILFPPYENKELLSFSFYGTHFEQDEFKELSELVNSNFFLEVFKEVNKKYNG